MHATMRTSTSSVILVLLLVPLLLAARASRAAAEASSASTSPRLAGRGAGGGKAAEAFYHKVGNFAVVMYSIGHDISPVPKLQRVVSASTRPAPGSAVYYLLVLRVARLGTCEALVWGIAGEGSHDWKLKYFKPEAL